MPRFSTYLLLLTFLNAIPALSAQSDAMPMVSVDFQVISWKGTIRDVYFDNRDGDTTEIKAFSHIRSQVYSYNGPQELVLYVKGTDEQGLPIKIPVARSTIPLTESKLLLILAKVGDDNYRVLQLPDDSSAFPYGAFKIMNLTKFPVAVKLQDNEMLIEPERLQVEAIPGNKDGSDLKVKIAISEPEGWKLLYANSWSHNDDQRTLALIFMDEDGKYFVRRFRERQAASQ